MHANDENNDKELIWVNFQLIFLDSVDQLLFQKEGKIVSHGNCPNFLGGGCSSVNSQQYSEKPLDVAFSSLPAIHIGNAEPLLGEVGGELSRSCPVPTLSSTLEPPTSKESGLLANQARRKFFAPHWSDQAVEEAIEVRI